MCVTGWGGVKLDGSGESGTRSWFSLIEATIFSRFSEEMCGCFREWLSLRRTSGDARRREAMNNPSSESVDSVLVERAGRVVGAEVDVEEAGCLGPWSGVERRCGAQQKDSLENNLQLKFSSRLPSSIA